MQSVRLALLGFALLPWPAFAQTITLGPTGKNPTGAATVKSQWYYAGPPEALSGQLAWWNRYTIDTNGTSGWQSGASQVGCRLPWTACLKARGDNRNVVFEDANGSIEIDQYYVWSDQLGVVNQGLQTKDALNVPGWAGAVMGLKWVPGPTVGLAATAIDPWQFWIQLFNTNTTSRSLPAYAKPVQFPFATDWWFIDANNNNPALSFYNYGATASTTNFLDVPYFAWTPGEYVMCFTFKAYERDANTIAISNWGVSWGYYMEEAVESTQFPH